MTLFDAVVESINLARPGLPDQQVATMAAKMIGSGIVHLNHKVNQRYTHPVHVGDVVSYHDFIFDLQTVIFRRKADSHASP